MFPRKEAWKDISCDKWKMGNEMILVHDRCHSPSWSREQSQVTYPARMMVLCGLGRVEMAVNAVKSSQIGGSVLSQKRKRYQPRK